MKQVNLVYDGMYDDADILILPDHLTDRLCQLPGQYSEYLKSRGIVEMETEGFVEWLNQYQCLGSEKVQILHMHVSVNEHDMCIFF